MLIPYFFSTISLVTKKVISEQLLGRAQLFVQAKYLLQLKNIYFFKEGARKKVTEGLTTKIFMVVSPGCGRGSLDGSAVLANLWLPALDRIFFRLERTNHLLRRVRARGSNESPVVCLSTEQRTNWTELSSVHCYSAQRNWRLPQRRHAQSRMQENITNKRC